MSGFHGKVLICLFPSCNGNIFRTKTIFISAMKADTFDEESETDSEEEILFESSKKGKRPNGSVPNGYIKNGKLNT